MEEDIYLADAAIRDALNREDELGRLVSRAFSFPVPPFGVVRGALATSEGEGGNA